jgi:tritrans,polycis-undecaprenyl-diphosphate synthase [geranylgeranyl-diphosphate specific]
MEIPRIIMDKAYSSYEVQLKQEVLSRELPKHIAVIMDGNRRYAREMLDGCTFEGHRLGKEKLHEVMHWCRELGIKYFTAYAFSTENFNREQDEVDYLMDLLREALYEFGDDEEVHQYHVRIRVIGDRDMLPEHVIEAIDYAESKTAGYEDFTLNMAIAYGGRQDIVSAVRQIAQRVKDGEMDVEDIDESVITSHISTNESPDPDMILRTSGELRISNFLLWQMAYSEFYFADVNWPEFRYIDFLRAIRTYQQRKRRYGA